MSSSILSLQGAAIVGVVLIAAVAGCLGSGTIIPATLPDTTTVAPPHPPHYLPLYTSSLVVMQKDLVLQNDKLPNMTLSIPTYMPEGFFFFSGTLAQGSWISPQGEGYCLFTYHRGQDEWVDLMERSRNSLSCPDRAEYRAAEEGTLLAIHGATGELWWGRDGWCYNLSGSLPQKELEKIAESVKPVPYREGIMPPYEYQPPAHPLDRTIIINRNTTVRGLTITVKSLECTPNACTALIGLGSGPLPSVSPASTGIVQPTLPQANPDLHAEWRVDGGRPLMTMPGGGYMFNETSVRWKIEPLPEDSRELEVNISRAGGMDGPWRISIPLDGRSDTDPPAASQLEDSS
jgi:hypothetical protein